MSFESETGRDLYFAQLDKELGELIDPQTGLLSSRYSKRVGCPLCQGNSSSQLFVKRGYTFVRCQECGLVFSNPQVTQELVEKTYRNDLSSTELWMKVLLNEKEVAWRGQYYHDILSHIESRIPKGRVLDVGCAVGHFLTLAREKGWTAVGLELSDTAATHCINTLNLEVYRKTLQEISMETGRFDAVTLLGVLEHVPDPLKVMKQAWQVVRPGGLVAVVVPNMYSLLNLFLREKAATFDGRNHLIYFSKSSLESCLGKAGFEVLHTDTVLTGIPNIAKYIQFYDPFGNDGGIGFVPGVFQSYLQDKQGRDRLERLILDADLGLRLRIFGKKPEK